MEKSPFKILYDNKRILGSILASIADQYPQIFPLRLHPVNAPPGGNPLPPGAQPPPPAGIPPPNNDTGTDTSPGASNVKKLSSAFKGEFRDVQCFINKGIS